MRLAGGDGSRTCCSPAADSVLRRRPTAGLPFVLVNNYGPTECTVVATSGVVSPDGDGPPSIGRCRPPTLRPALIARRPAAALVRP